MVWYYTIFRTERIMASQKYSMQKVVVELAKHFVTESTGQAIRLVNNSTKQREVKRVQKLIITIVDYGKQDVACSLVIEEKEDGSWSYDDGTKEVLFPTITGTLEAVRERSSQIKLDASGEARLC